MASKSFYIEFDTTEGYRYKISTTDKEYIQAVFMQVIAGKFKYWSLKHV